MSDDESSDNCSQCKQPLARRDRICKKCGTKVSRRPQFLTIAPPDSRSQGGLSEQVPVDDGDFLHAVDAQSLTDGLLTEDIGRVLATLSKGERDVLRMRFGLDGGRQRTLEDVGKHFGMTTDKVRALEKAALKALRHPNKRTVGSGRIASAKRIPRKELINVLNNFSAEEQVILKLKWGFTDGRCHSAQEISELIGVTIEQIRQLEGQVFNPPEVL